MLIQTWYRTAPETLAQDNVGRRVFVIMAPAAGARRACGPVHAHIPAGAVHGETLDASPARCRGVDGGPADGVVGHVDAIAGGVGAFPAQHHAADRAGTTQVDVDPLRVTGEAAPPGGGPAVESRRGSIATLP